MRLSRRRGRRDGQTETDIFTRRRNARDTVRISARALQCRGKDGFRTSGNQSPAEFEKINDYGI